MLKCMQMYQSSLPEARHHWEVEAVRENKQGRYFVLVAIEGLVLRESKIVSLGDSFRLTEEGRKDMEETWAGGGMR